MPLHSMTWCQAQGIDACCLISFSKTPVLDLCCWLQTPSHEHPENFWGVLSERRLVGGHTARTMEAKEMGRGLAYRAVNTEQVMWLLRDRWSLGHHWGCSSLPLGCSCLLCSLCPAPTFFCPLSRSGLAASCRFCELPISSQ